MATRSEQSTNSTGNTESLLEDLRNLTDRYGNRTVQTGQVSVIEFERKILELEEKIKIDRKNHQEELQKVEKTYGNTIKDLKEKLDEMDARIKGLEEGNITTTENSLTQSRMEELFKEHLASLDFTIQSKPSSQRINLDQGSQSPPLTFERSDIIRDSNEFATTIESALEQSRSSPTINTSQPSSRLEQTRVQPRIGGKFVKVNKGSTSTFKPTTKTVNKLTGSKRTATSPTDDRPSQSKKPMPNSRESSSIDVESQSQVPKRGPIRTRGSNANSSNVFNWFQRQDPQIKGVKVHHDEISMSSLSDYSKTLITTYCGNKDGLLRKKLPFGANRLTPAQQCMAAVNEHRELPPDSELHHKWTLEDALNGYVCSNHASEDVTYRPAGVECIVPDTGVRFIVANPRVSS